MHNESNKVRSIDQKSTTAEPSKDNYLELVKQLMLREIIEDAGRGPGPTADCLIFHYIMISNWAFPISANVLYTALEELEAEGLIKYDPEECNITLIAKIH